MQLPQRLQSWSPQPPFTPSPIPRNHKPQPSNLFSSREMESASLRFVPRLCSLTLVKMMLFKEVEKSLSFMVISMKVQGSKLISVLITMKMQGYKHIL